MTDLDAYELMLQSCGGEKELSMIRMMIHTIGAKEAANEMSNVYKSKGVQIPEDFKQWMEQAFNYMNSKNKTT